MTAGYKLGLLILPALAAGQIFAYMIHSEKLSLEASLALFLAAALSREMWFITFFADLLDQATRRVYLASTILLICMSIGSFAAKRDSNGLGYYLLAGLWLVMFAVMIISFEHSAESISYSW